MKVLKNLVNYINTKKLSNTYMKSIVTRGGQITISKEIREKLGIREGTQVEINTVGDLVVISKRNKDFWKKCGGFLPKDFKKTLREMRKIDSGERLKKLRIIK